MNTTMLVSSDGGRLVKGRPTRLAVIVEDAPATERSGTILSDLERFW